MTRLGAHIARVQMDTVRLGLCEGDLANPSHEGSAGAGASVWTSRRCSGRERERLAGGERRPQLCRSVAGDGVEPQRQQPAEQRGVADGAGTDAEPGRLQGADQRGREEEVLDADAVQPGCLRPAGERVDAVVVMAIRRVRKPRSAERSHALLKKLRISLRARAGW